MIKQEFDKIFEKYKKIKFPINLNEEKNKMYEYVYYSNKLEGNKMDLSQTIALLKDNMIVGDKVRYFDVLEMKGHYKALSFIINAAMNKYPLTIRIVKETNKLLLSSLWKDDDNYYSTWKTAGQIIGECKVKDNKIVYEYNGKYGEIMPLSTKENSENNLNNLIENINNSKSHIIEKVSKLAYGLYINQFFPDGNKRTARLMTSFMTIKKGLPLSSFNKTKTNFNSALLATYLENNKLMIIEHIAKNLITDMAQKIEKEKKLRL